MPAQAAGFSHRHGQPLRIREGSRSNGQAKRKTQRCSKEQKPRKRAGLTPEKTEHNRRWSSRPALALRDAQSKNAIPNKAGHLCGAARRLCQIAGGGVQLCGQRRCGWQPIFMGPASPSVNGVSGCRRACAVERERRAGARDGRSKHRR